MRDIPNTILGNQLKLVEYLDELMGHSIMIKSLPFSNYENLGILPVLEKTRNIKVINNFSSEDALSFYDVKAVLLDHVTTTLYEALPHDLEIFVVNQNEARPIEERALNELKRRVRYAKMPTI